MLIQTRTPGWNPRSEAWMVKSILEGLARAARPFMRGLPPLYGGSIRFAREPNHGRFEEFALPWDTAKRGWGDCDDLIIYRLAELEAAGKKGSVACKWFGTEFHVQIRLPNGKIEDPSVRLGAPVNWPLWLLRK